MSVIDCSKCIHCEVCGNRYANDGYAGECSYFLEYKPSEDLISRSALKEQVKNEVCEVCFTSPDERQCSPNCKLCTFNELINNAPPVEQSIKVVCRSRNWSTDCTVTSGFEDGYRHGYRKAKEDIAKRIKDQYNEHHELIPYWLSIGDTKGGAEE